MAVKPTEPEIVENPVELPAGFHVMFEGSSLGCYPSAEEAEAFANAHPREQGLTVEVKEVTV